MDEVKKNVGLPFNQFFDVAERGGRGFDESDLDELRQAADAFEAIFVAQFIKTARASKLADDVFGNQASDTYQSMLDDQYSRKLASSANLGIAEALVDQLSGSFCKIWSAIDGKSVSILLIVVSRPTEKLFLLLVKISPI